MAGEPNFAAIDPKEPVAEPQIRTPALGPAGDWVEIDFDRYQTASAARGSWRAWVKPALALLALAGWTGFFIWANISAMIVVHDPGIWTGWASTWAAPALLVGVVWLIGTRLGPVADERETARFAEASRLLAEENERLSASLHKINSELSLAREFVTAQARDLDSVGRIAVDRLSGHAERLQALVHQNSSQIEAIGTVSGTALENMERLRSQLPVLTSAAKDVTNNFGNAGRTANAQLQDLIVGFNRLTQFGQLSEDLVMKLRGSIDHALSGFVKHSEALEASMAGRLDALHGKADLFHTSLLAHQGEFESQLRSRTLAMAAEIADTRSQLDSQEAESITSLRSRLSALRDETAALGRALRDGEGAALTGWRDAVARLTEDLHTAERATQAFGQQTGEASRARMAALTEETAAAERALRDIGASLDAETDRRQQAAEAHAHTMIAAITAQLAALDEDVARRHAAQTTNIAALSSQSLGFADQLAEIESRIAAIAQSSGAAEAATTHRLGMIAQRLDESRKALAATDDALSATDTTLKAVTYDSVRLLELIQASAAHSREDLADAIDKGASRLGELETRALALRDTVGDASREGEALSSYVLLTHDRLADATGALSTLHGDVTSKAETHARLLDGLHQALARLDSDSAAAAERAQNELTAAIGQLTQAAHAAVAQIEQQGAAPIAALAAKLGEDSGEAMERAMRLQVAEVAGKLEQAAAHAAGIGREATQHLRGELGKVEDLIGNLENRIANARSRAVDTVDNDFGRRVALITEALNSNAIDIAKALNSDVSDTAWAAYLRGDRGIFTRKAVRLLDTSEARSVIQLYEADRHFRDHVSHYIHDFEAMLRELLSTRDGHAMGVTLLSSDMGKLYVALAQAIERLRA